MDHQRNHYSLHFAARFGLGERLITARTVGFAQVNTGTCAVEICMWGSHPKLPLYVSKALINITNAV